MKNLIMSVLTVMIAIFSYAQTVEYKGGVEDLKNGVEQGKFIFTFSESTSEEEINKNAQYYTNTLKVEYSSDSKEAIISMVDNSEMGRRVITRFLLSNGIKAVIIDGNKYTLNDFFDKYLK